jgi:type IV pilus assembly protein PilE
MPSLHRTTQLARGFTLLEIMITVGLVGILAAIAIPSYSYVVNRSRVIEATTALSDMRNRMEKSYFDNRTYLVAGKCAVDADMTAYNSVGSNKFTLTCPPGTFTATAYQIRADGNGPMAGFIYTINQQNIKTTLGTSYWGVTSGNCWVSKQDGTCF